MALGGNKSFDAGKGLLRVAWLAVLLGLTMEAILVMLAAGFGTLRGANPILADVVQKVSWSVVVCVGLALGTAAKKARARAMGLSGLLAAPLGFLVATSLHKSAMHALGLAGTAPNVSLVLIAFIKGLQYGIFGLLLYWIARRSGGLLAYLMTGLVIGIVFGGTIILLTVSAAPQMPPLSSLMSRAANEFLFPVGCAFVIYVSKLMKRHRADSASSV